MRVLKDHHLEKEVLLTIPKNDLLQFLHAELLSRAHQVKKPGFRAGKVPLDVVFQERGSEAIDVVVRQFVSQAFSEIVGERSLGAPLSYRVDQNLQGTSLDRLPDILEIHVYAIFQPEIPEIHWKDIQLSHFVPHPNEQEVDQRVAEIASQTMTSVALSEKRTALKGDTLVYTMRYVHRDGTVKETEGSFQLGSNALPAEFESVLEGISEGHVFNQSLRVPKDFPDKSLAGKKVQFTITFHEIRSTVPHQPDEVFAKSQGFENLQALRENIRKSLVDSGEVLSDILLLNAVKKKLGDLVHFEVPESWEASALTALQKSYLQTFPKQTNHDPHSVEISESGESATAKQTPEITDQVLVDLKSRAHALVAANCIVQKVINEQGFSVQDSEILAYARAMARSEGKSLDDVVGFLRRNNGLVDRIANEIKERKALKWISAECSKEDTELSLEALNNLTKESL